VAHNDLDEQNKIVSDLNCSPQNPESNTKQNMTVKINDTICPVRQDASTDLYYVDLDGQATSGASTDELLQNLRESYTSVSAYPEASE